jgi:DNA-directed RNA polymerase specialized sigma24 family protein
MEGDAIASLNTDELEDEFPDPHPPIHAAKKKSAALAERIVAVFRNNPELSRRRLAERFGCNVTTVENALKSAGLFVSRARK